MIAKSKQGILLLNGAQPILHEPPPESEYYVYDKDRKVNVDIRSAVALHLVKEIDFGNTRITEVKSETTDDN